MTSRTRAAIAPAVAIALTTLAGCGGDSNADTDASPGSSVARDGTREAESSSSGDYLDELYADALHADVAPAGPGTAYLEVAGERLDFDDLTCSLDETPGAEQLRVEARNADGHMMYLDRQIGPDIGWSWEDELVQLALLTTAGGGDAADQFSNSLAQHEREEDGAPEWDQGGGSSPMIRIVGDEATATGTLAAAMLADSPLEGDFVAAATCP